MLIVLMALLSALNLFGQGTEPGAKAMFYNPGGVATQTPGRFIPDPSRRLREVNYLTPLKHCGIHYWLENDKGMPVPETAANSIGGRFALYVRASCNGFLTVFDMDGEGKELTPRTDPRFSGHNLGDQIFRVPGLFAFMSDDSAKRLIVVWARSQTEVARSAADAPARLADMPRWMPIVKESDESTPGEIGTYVVNRTDAGVPAEILFKRQAQAAQTATQVPTQSAIDKRIAEAEAEGARHPRARTPDQYPRKCNVIRPEQIVFPGRTATDPYIWSGDFDAVSISFGWDTTYEQAKMPLRVLYPDAIGDGLQIRLVRLDPPDNVYAPPFALNGFNASSGERFFASWPKFPTPGKWMMIMTAGSNWGCFVLDRPVK